jgi:hypothetical protein
MARFKLVLNLGNEWMQSGEDVADALRRVARDVEHIPAAGMEARQALIRDTNGNTVGRWFYSHEEW